MATDLGLDELVRGVSKKYLSGFRSRVERLLEAAVKADRNPFNDGATASAAQSSALNPGQVIAYAGLNAPTGFLECNGTEVSTAQYPALAAILGTRFGTAAAGKVKLPNPTEAAIMGAGGTRVAGVATAAGSSFENNTTSLTIAHLPEHQHVIDTICEENPGHVHDVLAYPNFGVNVPGNFKRGPISGSGASDGDEVGASFGDEMEAGPDYEDGASGQQGIDDWRAARTRSYTTYTRSTQGDGPSSNPDDDPDEDADKSVDVVQFDAVDLALGAATTGGAIVGLVAASPVVIFTALGVTATAGIGYGIRQFYNTDGSRNTDVTPDPSPAPAPVPTPTPGQPGTGTRPNIGGPIQRPSLPNVSNPNAPTGPRSSYVFSGRGIQAQELNNRNFGNIPDAPALPGGNPLPPAQRPNVPNPGAPTPGSNPDDTNRPGSTPLGPGSTGPGSRPNNQGPGNTNPGGGTPAQTKPAEDKSTAPPVATRENPFDTTYYSQSQREEFNEAIETFYEDYSERLGSGAAAWNTFINNPGLSYGQVDATALTGLAGGHTHTTSGTMLETGGSGYMGVQQPSFALMWIIKT